MKEYLFKALSTGLGASIGFSAIMFASGKGFNVLTFFLILVITFGMDFVFSLLVAKYKK